MRYAAATAVGMITAIMVGTQGTVTTAEPVRPTARQAVLWTSGDPEVAHRMALMYCQASHDNKWFDEHQLIVWGPSARLLAADKDLQQKVRQMLAKGITVKACIVCAESYGVTAKLRELGIEVRPMGKPLAELQRAGWHVLAL
jgi:hypothetical protein